MQNIMINNQIVGQKLETGSSVQYFNMSGKIVATYNKMSGFTSPTNNLGTQVRGDAGLMFINDR